MIRSNINYNNLAGLKFDEVSPKVGEEDCTQ